MRGDASAFAALGLEPGADPASIDRAYRKLIKLYHPDRSGGDARRAAEINQAYRQLRGRPAPVDAFSFGEGDVHEGESGGWARAAVVLVIALVALLVATGPGAALMRDLGAQSAAPATVGRVTVTARASDPMDQPLDRAVLDNAISEAVRMKRSGDNAALLDASRTCQRTLRVNPNVRTLDRCAAFDDAIVEMEDWEPLWDGGPFSQPAVARRQWAAASALSNDYLAVDSRLDRIRLHVELALAPREPEPAMSKVPRTSDESEVPAEAAD